MTASPARALAFQGRVWLFGDEINTDDMFPGFAMKLPLQEAARHMFHSSRPGFADLVEAGDVIVGGRSFGMGSSRPVPPLLEHLGIAGVVAESFNSLFLRNCINYGLPALPVPGIRHWVAEGQVIRVNVDHATVYKVDEDAALHGTVYPQFILDILRAGGLLRRLEMAGLLQSSSGALGTHIRKAVN